MSQSTSVQQTDRSSHGKEIESSSEAEFSFGFEVSTGSIVDLFEEVAISQGFEMIEKELQHATAIKQIRKSLLQYLDCFNWVTEGSMTALKLTIHTSEKNSLRIIRIKGLIGSKREVKAFVQAFRTKSEVLVKELPFQMDENEQMLEEPDNPFHLQACAAYMFHKLLSNEKYGIGNMVGIALKTYINDYSDVEKAVKTLPIPMKVAMTIVREAVDNLYKDFNMGRKEMEKIMPYCRISVQRYVFDRIESILTPIYSHRASEQNTIFQQKRTRIFAQKRLKDIFAEINLQSHNWIFEETWSPERLETVVGLRELRGFTKYRKACEELQKMAHVSNPREKMKHCQIAYSVLKALVYESSAKKHGKAVSMYDWIQQELSNMEDIIPIFILVLLLGEVPEVKAQLDMIVDFIEFDSCDLESERRLLLNLSESFNFVYRDWKV